MGAKNNIWLVIDLSLVIISTIITIVFIILKHKNRQTSVIVSVLLLLSFLIKYFIWMK